MFTRKWLSAGVVLAAIAFASVAAPASAALVIELDYEFSGATAPSGTPPWLRATFTTEA